MWIALVMPGTCGAFYCENCLRDLDLAEALARLGHEVRLVPLYLPLTAAGPDPGAGSPLFFGGINVYLQQKSALFRRLPRWIGRALDARWLLRWASRRAAMTSAGDLAEATLSMLRGEGGRQARELERLAGWLAEARPQAVCLSNALLLGLVRRVKEAVGAPLVCLLQDEAAFLDALPEPARGQAWREASERARDVDVFIASSRYYAAEMERRLGLVPERVRVVYNAIDLEGYAPAAAPPAPPVVGFLSPALREKGLGLLVEAFERLRQSPRLADLKLRAAGGRTAGSGPFVEELRERIRRAGLEPHVDLLPNLGRAARQEFLRGLSVLSVPTERPEASALYVLEALGSGVPVVEPRHGAAVELVEATSGGVLVEPNDAAALAEGIEGLLLDPVRARELAARGREAVRERFGIERAARQVVEILEGVAPAARP